jgi:hypothetical protein
MKTTAQGPANARPGMETGKPSTLPRYAALAALPVIALLMLVTPSAAPPIRHGIAVSQDGGTATLVAWITHLGTQVLFLCGMAFFVAQRHLERHASAGYRNTGNLLGGFAIAYAVVGLFGGWTLTRGMVGLFEHILNLSVHMQEDVWERRRLALRLSQALMLLLGSFYVVGGWKLLMFFFPAVSVPIRARPDHARRAAIMAAFVMLILAALLESADSQLTPTDFVPYSEDDPFRTVYALPALLLWIALPVYLCFRWPHQVAVPETRPWKLFWLGSVAFVLFLFVRACIYFLVWPPFIQSLWDSGNIEAFAGYIARHPGQWQHFAHAVSLPLLLAIVWVWKRWMYPKQEVMRPTPSK